MTHGKYGTIQNAYASVEMIDSAHLGDNSICLLAGNFFKYRYKALFYKEKETFNMGNISAGKKLQNQSPMLLNMT